MSRLRSLAHAFARTPLHPQWLLGRRRPPPGMQRATGTLLDIGAADRWLIAYLPASVHYIALDYPATGGAMYHARPDVFADGAALPFADASIDHVSCLEVLEHVPDPANVIAEVARVLRPGGMLWLSMPFLYPVHDAPHDFQRYTAFGLRRDLERAGLQVNAIRKSGHAVRTAGLLACLAIAGGMDDRRGPALMLLPAAAALVLLINCSAWLFSLFWPDWSGIGAGYEAEACRP